MNADALTPYLLAGESLVWWGTPRQGLILAGRDAFLIPFSLMWGGFALFWESTALLSRAPSLFKLWGMPFMLIGLYMIFGRFFLDAWVRRKTLYAFTNKRVLILRGSPFAKFTALGLDQLPTVELKEGGNGRGTIRFVSASMFNMFSSGRWSVWTPSLDPTPQFLGIEDVRNVFTEVQTRAANARRGQG